MSLSTQVAIWVPCWTLWRNRNLRRLGAPEQRAAKYEKAPRLWEVLFGISRNLLGCREVQRCSCNLRFFLFSMAIIKIIDGRRKWSQNNTVQFSFYRRMLVQALHVLYVRWCCVIFRCTRTVSGWQTARRFGHPQFPNTFACSVCVSMYGCFSGMVKFFSGLSVTGVVRDFGVCTLLCHRG